MEPNPETIGRYRIEGVLGRGAMGVVYRAHDPEIDRPVAIKLIRADLLHGEDRADYVLRFRREAQAAGRCVHPNIVGIYDFATHDGNPFLAMELVDGVSLRDACERGTIFAPADAGFVVLQMLDALAAAHLAGIVHRDIKPANIMLVRGTLVKVTDFGISRFDSSTLTGDGSAIGTPSYMSPEQCRGLAMDARSDLFSTAVVLYELLCGERPFVGRSTVEVMQRVLSEAHADISARNPDVSPALKSVVDRALAKSPADRYASASEMAAALRAALVAEQAVADLSDRTIVVPPAHESSALPSQGSDRLQTRGTPAEGTLTGRFDGAVLATLERRLAEHVGPIARVLLQNAMRTSGTTEALCDRLASSIAQPQERDRFRTQTLAQLRRAPVSSGAAPARPPLIPATELERAQKELARYLGPIARVLVRRTAPEADSAAELWQQLSLHIEREDDRQAFLRHYQC